MKLSRLNFGPRVCLRFVYAIERVLLIGRSTSIHKISKIPSSIHYFYSNLRQNSEKELFFELWYLFEPFRLVSDGLQVARVFADRLGCVLTSLQGHNLLF